MNVPPPMNPPPSATAEPVDDLREKVSCLVCGVGDSEPWIELEETLEDIGGRFTLQRCRSCAHLYLSPRPTADDIGRFYPTRYYQQVEAPAAESDNGDTGADAAPPLTTHIRHQGGRRVRRVQLALRQHLGYPGEEPITFWRKLATWPMYRKLMRSRSYVDTLPWAGEGRLLDFGLGNGRFLRLQRQRGWVVAGMDFNPEVVEHARRNSGIEAQAGTWPGEAFANQQFDVITSWHVIEHLPDPVGYLHAAAERLAPGGYLLTCCPNAASWACWLFKGHWLGYDTPRHFSVFTRPQMIRLVEEAGLTFIRHRPQVRPATFRTSCAIRAKQTGSRFWGWMSRRRFFWSVIARLSGLANRCDCMIIYAQKPMSSSTLMSYPSQAILSDTALVKRY